MHPDPWIAAMRRGDFNDAWTISDRVLQRRRGEDCSNWPRHLQFIWDGSPFAARRVLVRCYHGLGDTLQFVRLLAPLRQQAGEVILWAQPQLLELLRTVRGIDRLLPLHDGVPDVSYDVDIELMELPHALRITAQMITDGVPYVRLPDTLLPRPRRACDPDRPICIGLAWSSGGWDTRRSTPDDAIEKLGSVDGVRWFSLQYPQLRCSFTAEPLGCRDICELARRMLRLDLIIAVDTMIAHLAGALGMPVWTLLPVDADWRWMSDRNDTPWYPTMRLFRQTAADDWHSVVDRVIAALDILKLARGTRSNGCTAF